MILQPYTYDGHTLNDTSYETIIPMDAPMSPVSEAVYIERSNAFPKYAGARMKNSTLPLIINMKGTKHSQRQTIKQWFDTSNATMKKLICIDTADSNKQWYVYAKPITVTLEDTPNLVTVVLALDDPLWRTETENHSTAALTASGQTLTLTVGGNAQALPRIVITPTSNKTTGYLYRYWIPIKNKLAVKLKSYPLDLTNGGMNTAALVTALKMRSDGADIRVWTDGAETNRWLGSMNTAATKIWTVVDLEPMVQVTLGAAILAGDTVTELSVKSTIANIKTLKKNKKLLLASGLLMIGSEAFTYTGIDVSKMKFTGVTRAARGTTAAGHSIADAIDWVQHDMWIVHGDLLATAPTVDDTKKPAFDAASSTNTSWVYAQFTRSGGKMAGAWKPAVVKSANKKADIYTATQATDADPATAMGLSMYAALKGTRWRAETATLRWSISNPVGITAVTSAGKKYRYATSFPSKAHLEARVQVASKWKTIEAWNEASPSSAQTWESWTHTGSALSTAASDVDFEFDGSVNGSASNAAHFEVTSVTLTLNSSNVPTITAISSVPEQTNYNLTARITNSANSKFIDIAYAMPLNKSIVVDTDAKTVIYDGATGALAALTVPETRQDWLPLEPGVSNVLTFDDALLVALTLDVYWRDRSI